MARKLKTSETVATEVDVEKNNDTALLATVKLEAESTVYSSEVDMADATTNSHDQCGGALRAARIGQNLSTQTIAKQLRLGNAQIEALENNQFSALPEPTIVKGFIRNYAKLLKIPPEPILAAYSELMPKTDQYAFALGPGINMKMSENTKLGSARYLLLTLLLLIMLGGWFFYQHYIQKPDVVDPMPEVTDMLPEEVFLQMPAPTIETVLPANDIADDFPTKLQSSQELTADYPSQNTTRLVFNAKQETWLSVVNQSGEEVYNKILYAGKRDIVDIEQPSEIVVGNAQGAMLTIDDKPIDLAPYTRMNVARIRLNPETN
jgi:cytoskeleton protein RodZ